MNTTTKTIIAAILITLISGIAVADTETNWTHEKRNIAPAGIEHVYYDFEEGSNLVPFRNSYPDVAAFMNVISDPDAWDGTDEPSYVCKCARAMHIYPCDYYTNPDGTPVDFIYIVNGRCAFSPRTGMDMLGKYWPSRNAYIVFKDDTHYVSFLACTGGNMHIRLYDSKGTIVHYETISRTIDRVGSEPSNFTRFEIHILVRGGFNQWHFDGLIVGGEPGYLPLKPVDYTYVARLAQELWGVDYLEYGLGHDYVMMDYMDAWQFTDGAMGEYWNPETKAFEEGEGISNAGLILWAYNYDADDLAGTSFVKRNTVAGMEKHDFKIDVDPAATQPGDVCFMDRDFDGTADAVYMVTEEHDGGFDLITACPDSGVINSKSSIVEGSPAFMGYKRLPGVIRGGKNPIPKGH
jgi:hypothetical protein